MFNKSEIMKKAWKFKKEFNMKFNECLKKAWAFAKMKAETIEKTIEKIVDKYVEISFAASAYAKVNVWEKYGYKRLYISIYNAGKKYDAGYCDLTKKIAYVPATRPSSRKPENLSTLMNEFEILY